MEKQVSNINLCHQYVACCFALLLFPFLLIITLITNSSIFTYLTRLFAFEIPTPFCSVFCTLLVNNNNDIYYYYLQSCFAVKL